MSSPIPFDAAPFAAVPFNAAPFAAFPFDDPPFRREVSGWPAISIIRAKPWRCRSSSSWTNASASSRKLGSAAPSIRATSSSIRSIPWGRGVGSGMRSIHEGHSISHPSASDQRGAHSDQSHPGERGSRRASVLLPRLRCCVRLLFQDVTHSLSLGGFPSDSRAELRPPTSADKLAACPPASFTRSALRTSAGAEHRACGHSPGTCALHRGGTDQSCGPPA